MEFTSDEAKRLSSDNVNNPALENGGESNGSNPEDNEDPVHDPDEDLSRQDDERVTMANGEPDKSMTSENASASQVKSNTSGVFSQISQEWEMDSVDPDDVGAQNRRKEKMFLKKVEENNYVQVQAMLWKQKHEVQVDATNDLGYSALAMSCISNSVEMMKILLSCGCHVKEELLICIEQDFKEGARILLDKMSFDCANFVNKPPVEGRNIFPQGATAVKVASACNNVDMLKLLRYYSAEPIPMPDVAPEAGTQTLEETLFTMQALASPAYCLVMGSDDPLMTAMRVSTHCKKLGTVNRAQSKKYEELSMKMEGFASDWFGMAGDDYEVNMLIGLKDMTKITSQSLLQEDKYCRLRYAIENRHATFVAHPYCQSALLNALSTSMPSKWSGRPTPFKLLCFAAMLFISPLWILLYWLFPKTDSSLRNLQPWLDWPYMKCLVAFIMYAVIQIALVATKNTFKILQWPIEPQPDGTFLKDLQKLSQNDVEVVPPFDLLNFYIFLWVIGNVWGEVQKVRKRGLTIYKHDTDSKINLITTLCFSISAFCCLIMWCSKYKDTEVKSTETVEEVYPRWIRNLSNIQEVFLVIGNICLFQRLVNWMRLSSSFGKTIYLIMVSLPDIFYFFVIFLFFLFSFSVSINGALWRTYADVLTVCDDALRAGRSVKTMTPVAGIRSEVIDVTCIKLAESYSVNVVESQNFVKGMISVRGTMTQLLFTLFGASPRNILLTQFNYYNSPQESVAALIFGFYTFFMVLVRLNILIALIVAALNQQYGRMTTEFKFHRAKVIIAFTDPDDPSWIPSPLNLIPTLRTVQTFFSDWIKKRRLASGSSDSTKAWGRSKFESGAQMKKEQGENEAKARKAIKVVINSNSRRMLRLIAKQKSQQILTVDNLQDLRAALNPLIMNAKLRLKGMQNNLKDLIKEKFPKSSSTNLNEN